MLAKLTLFFLESFTKNLSNEFITLKREGERERKKMKKKKQIMVSKKLNRRLLSI